MSWSECLQPRLCFAGQDAVEPCVTKFCVITSSTVTEPRTAVTATTRLAGFLNGAAFGAYKFACVRHDCWCSHVSINQRSRKSVDSCCWATLYMLSTFARLTFAGCHAVKPRVFHVSVAGSSAVLRPSTAGSATTDSAGFLERAALRACPRLSDRWGDG